MDSNKICAIIDAQGFSFNKKFIPREFSFVCDKFSLCFEIVPDVNNDEKFANFKGFSHQTHYIHGIPLNPVLDDGCKRQIKESQLHQLIEELNWMINPDNEYYLGVKNQQLKDFIAVVDIPLYDLEKIPVGGEMCPSLSMFDKFTTTHYCPLHSRIRDPRRVRCSIRKCTGIWEWLKNKRASDKIYDQIPFVTDPTHFEELKINIPKY